MVAIAGRDHVAALHGRGAQKEAAVLLQYQGDLVAAGAEPHAGGVRRDELSRPGAAGKSQAVGGRVLAANRAAAGEVLAIVSPAAGLRGEQRGGAALGA